MSGPLEWVYLHKKQPRICVPYLVLESALLIEVRFRTVSLLGFDPDIIVFHISKKEIECIIPFSEPLQ